MYLGHSIQGVEDIRLCIKDALQSLCVVCTTLLGVRNQVSVGYVGVVRVVRDALWAEGAARARFGVVRLVPVDGCGGGGGGRNLWTLDTGLDLWSYPVRVGRVVDVVV
jgi:hypothetical protein